MSILIDRNTRLVVQGITGRDGAFHTRQMLDYGTRVVAGVTPGEGGRMTATWTGRAIAIVGMLASIGLAGAGGDRGDPAASDRPSVKGVLLGAGLVTRRQTSAEIVTRPRQ